MSCVILDWILDRKDRKKEGREGGGKKGGERIQLNGYYGDCRGNFNIYRPYIT